MPHFPDLTPHLAGLSPYERDFAATEYGRGLDYYLARLEQLDFSGQRVLDAGCGQGQWSIALAHRFARVDAIDLKEERLGVLRSVAAAMGLDHITVRKGSIEQLPYEDEAFDAVFCYGVIMFTRMDTVLAELYRVLKPGGRLYVCLNGDGWNWYLVEKRGKNNPALQQSAKEILFSSYISRGTYYYFKSIPSFLRHTKYIPLLANIIYLCARFKKSDYISLFRNLGKEYLRKYSKYAAQALVSGPPTQQLDISRAYLPFELEDKLKRHGFIDFFWKPEGELFFYPVDACAPIYEGWYKGMLAVWEFCASKPAPPPLSLHILQYARAHQGLLPPQGFPPLLTACIPQTHYAPGLLQHWEQQAETLGGTAFLTRLVEELTQGASTERARFEYLVVFVQRALMRHPLYQPMHGDELPSPLAILLSGMGRCGHSVQVLERLLNLAGFQTRRRQYRLHVALEALVAGRWVLAEADIFKNGVLPVNEEGQLLGMDDIAREPRLLDCFPPTGWRFSSRSEHLATPWGRARGYVAAQDWHIRGYISSYFTAGPGLAPPAVPQGLELSRKGEQATLSWQPACAPSDPLRHYEVFVGTQSRGWRDDDTDDTVLRPLPRDVLHCTTTETVCRFFAPPGALFASVKAVGMQSVAMPATCYWPSEEIFINDSTKLCDR